MALNEGWIIPMMREIMRAALRMWERLDGIFNSGDGGTEGFDALVADLVNTAYQRSSSSTIDH